MVEQRIWRVAAALGLLLLLFPGSGVAAEHDVAAERAPTVILLSFDGVRHDYLDREGLPALERIARTGARARSLTPVFPASTFSSHVALATGAHTDRHGIVGNRFHDPKKGDFDYSNDASFIEAEPIWATAERQGVRSATFFWVGSETGDLPPECDEFEGVSIPMRGHVESLNVTVATSLLLFASGRAID